MDEIDSVHNRLFNIENMLTKIVSYQQNQHHCSSDIDNDCDCRSECNCKQEQEPNQNSFKIIQF